MEEQERTEEQTHDPGLSEAPAGVPPAEEEGEIDEQPSEQDAGDDDDGNEESSAV